MMLRVRASSSIRAGQKGAGAGAGVGGGVLQHGRAGGEGGGGLAAAGGWELKGQSKTGWPVGCVCECECVCVWMGGVRGCVCVHAGGWVVCI